MKHDSATAADKAVKDTPQGFSNRTGRDVAVRTQQKCVEVTAVAPVEDKTIADRLREMNREDACGCSSKIFRTIAGLGRIDDCLSRGCDQCFKDEAKALADMIEAEQAELRANYKDLHDNFFTPCVNMGFDKNAHGLEATYNAMYLMLQGKGCCIDFKALDLLCDKLECGGPDNRELAKQIRKAMNGAERSNDGVDVDSLLKVADELDIPKDSYSLYMDKASAHRKRDIIRDAVKGANPSKSTGLPEGVIWPRFEDGELVKPFDKLPGFDSGGVQKFIWTSSHNGAWQLQDAEGHMLNVMHGEFVKRPEPDTFKSILSEMVSAIECEDCVDLDPYIERYRKLLGGE